MQESILRRLDSIVERHQEVEQLLAQPDVIADQEKFRELNREYSRLQVMVDTYKEFKTCSSDLEEMEMMLSGDDEEMRAMAEEEVGPTRERLEKLEHDLQSYCCLTTSATIATASLKSVLVLVAMKLLYLLASCSDCTPSTASKSTGL